MLSLYIYRCWTYETSVCTDTPVDPIIPYNDYLEYFGPDYLLKIPTSNMENCNTMKYLDTIRNQV